MTAKLRAAAGIRSFGDDGARSGRGLFAQDAHEFAGIGAAQAFGRERQTAREQFVEHHAEGVDVRARVDVDLVGGLLRTHVFERADEAAVRRQQRDIEQSRAERLRDSEVDHRRRGTAVAIAHEDVRRLEIAVQDALLVRGLDRVADGREQIDARRQVERAFVAIARDRLPGHEVHAEERPFVGRHPGVEDARHVGVFEQRQCLPFDGEAGQDLARVHARADDLDRDLALHGFVLLREVDRA